MSRFELWRQDDNGNRFPMSVHPDRAAAEAAAAAMEAGVQHKQLYYVIEVGRADQDPGSDPGSGGGRSQAPRPAGSSQPT